MRAYVYTLHTKPLNVLKCTIKEGTSVLNKWHYIMPAYTANTLRSAIISPIISKQSGHWLSCDLGRVRLWRSRSNAIVLHEEITSVNILSTHIPIAQWASYQIRKIADCACAWNGRNVFPATDLKETTSYWARHASWPCVTHMPWCISGSLTRGGGENVPGIPGACTARSLTYLARAPCTPALPSLRYGY